MRIRHARTSDVPALAELFTAAVHTLTTAHYDAEQRDAWAPRPPKPAFWRERLAHQHTLVAHGHARPVGFITYTLDGHIDLLFTAPAHARRGIASALYRQAQSQLHAHGVTTLHTDASLVARPFFRHHGFAVTQAQCVRVRGVMFRRFAMRKTIRS